MATKRKNVNKSAKKKRKVKRKGKDTTKIKLLLSSIVILVAVLGITFAYLFNMEFSTTSNTIKDESGEETVKYTEVKGVTNVLLLSNDARPGETVSRADSIMILTLDSNNKKLKITSLMRDMLVEIKGHGEEKLNHAFAYGGAELMMDTIQRNFGIKLDKYAIINFAGFKEIVDLLGGVEAEIKDYEIDELNKYIIDGGGSTADYIYNTGTQTLNGYQALSYARIRKVGNGEYERTERQRKLISTAVTKMKSGNLLKIPSIINEAFKYTETNLKLKDITNMALTALKMDFSNIDTFRLPLDDLAYGRLLGSKGWVFIIDKVENGKALKDFLFNSDRTYNVNTNNMGTLINDYINKYGGGTVPDDNEEENPLGKPTEEEDETIKDEETKPTPPIEKPSEDNDENNEQEEEEEEEEEDKKEENNGNEELPENGGEGDDAETPSETPNTPEPPNNNDNTEPPSDEGLEG